MKKNRMLRLASTLMILTLLTTSIIGGTFAKYTTTGSASDTARVAKWGMTVKASGNLFGENYNSHTATMNQDSIVATVSDNTNVKANNAAGAAVKNIVAPGTKNADGLKVEVLGTPEVAYTAILAGSADIEDIFLTSGTWGVMVAATNANASSDFSGNKYYTLTDGTYTAATAWVEGTPYYELIDEVTLTEKYYPLLWTFTKKATGTEDVVRSFRDLKTSFTTVASENSVGTYSAGSAPDISYTLTWEWPFEATENTAMYNGADTILGNLVAKNNGGLVDGTVVKKTTDTNTTSYNSATDGTDYNLDIKFEMQVTVTQVD